LALSFVQNGHGDYQLDWLTRKLSDPLKNLHHFPLLLERERVGGRRLCRADRSACDAKRSAAFPPPRPIAATLQSWCRNEDQYGSFTAPGGAMPMPDWVRRDADAGLGQLPKWSTGPSWLSP
jgi:hypothetical protein